MQEVINRAIGLSQGKGFIDVITLAKGYGIDVYLSNEKAEENEDFNACITYDKTTGKYAIYVNPKQPYERQRFSIAHELAHYFLHRDELIEAGELNRDPQDSLNREKDYKADKLAADILMPTPLVEEYIKDKEITKYTKFNKSIITKIADYFKVSRTVAAIRLRELKYFVPYISFA
ncbi:MAG TPA: ImmA/IrrE family metallo-endopeptidase [Candidatus Saccharimonadales bacterium]|nr:ImmA/IrrE family metallo-endopeptidase [Candidatus Saccharimonadales bacterium]